MPVSTIHLALMPIQAATRQADGQKSRNAWSSWPIWAREYCSSRSQSSARHCICSSCFGVCNPVQAYPWNGPIRAVRHVGVLLDWCCLDGIHRECEILAALAIDLSLPSVPRKSSIQFLTPIHCSSTVRWVLWERKYLVIITRQRVHPTQSGGSSTPTSRATHRGNVPNLKPLLSGQ